MSRRFAIAVLGLCCALAAEPLAAESPATTAPPAWQDGASPYLTTTQQSVGEHEHALQPASYPPATLPVATPAPSLPVEATSRYDATITPAAFNGASEIAGDADRRHLEPPSDLSRTRTDNPSDGSTRTTDARFRAPSFGLPLSSLYTMLSALGIVIGSFLLCAWTFKRGTARRTMAMLPPEVVSVLGRVPLAARQFADLIRVGNKLVLITMTPTSAATLTEVTDPLEVDRLVGLCHQSDPQSTTKAFEQVFQQMSLEPARHGFLGNEPPLPSLQSTIDSLRAQRGDAASDA